MRGHRPAAHLSGQLGSKRARGSDCKRPDWFFEPGCNVKGLNSMLPEQGQSRGVGLSEWEPFSFFMLNFDPLPDWPLAFSFLFFFSP